MHSDQEPQRSFSSRSRRQGFVLLLTLMPAFLNAQDFDFKRYLFGTPQTLSAFVQSRDTSTGGVVLNGGDSQGPTTPFTWVWGDGNTSSSFFPASHTYADRYTNYLVLVIANYSGGAKDTVEVVVRFTVPAISPISIADSFTVAIPDTVTSLGTRLYPVPPQLTAFQDSFFTATPRATIAYVLSLSSVVEHGFINHDLYYYNNKFQQVMLRDSTFSGAYSLWSTDPVAFGVNETFLQGTIGYSSFFHEMGHNYTLNIPGSYYYGGKIDGNANAIYSEAMAQIFQHSAGYDIINNSDAYGLPDDLTSEIKASAVSAVNLVRNTYDDYVSGGKVFASWNNPATSEDETFGTFMTEAYMFLVKAETLGQGYKEPLKRMVKLLQGFDSDWETSYDATHNTADADTFRATLMVAAMSFGFQTDLRSEFRNLNFPISDSVYEELYGSPPAVTASAGTHGNITPSGTVLLTSGDDQAFTITPDVGYHVDSVLVDDGPVDSTAGYTFFNVTSYHTVRVVFTIDTHYVAATSGPNGNISPSGSVPVTYGSDRGFMVTPDGGYHIATLHVDSVLVDSTSTYTFYNVTTDHTIHAEFSNTYTITATSGPNGSLTPEGTVVVIQGDDQAFTVAPNSGYHLDSLYVDGTPVDSTAGYTFFNVLGDHTIHAVFADSSTITASAGPHGSITPSGAVRVHHGDNRAFSVSPGTGYHVDSVIVDDVKVDSMTSYTFTNVVTNHSIRAVFAIDTFVITASAGPGGTIAPDGAVVVAYGQNQQFTITPDGVSRIDEVLVDTVPVDSTTSYTFTNVTENHSISVSFDSTETVETAVGGNRWSLVSVPLAVDDFSKTELYPTATTAAYMYDGGYAEAPVLENGPGYWLKFGGPETVEMTGVPIPAETIAVSAGWNLIGSISDSVEVSAIGSVPGGIITSQFFGHSGSYQVVNVIEPGLGYFVKVSGAGSLVLSSGPLMPPEARVRIVPGPERPPAPPDHVREVSLPESHVIEQNYPNPFNPATEIRYGLREEGRVRIVIYSILGERVRVLVDEIQPAGWRTVRFDGSGLPSGVYICRMTVDGFSESRRMLLVR